MRTSQQCYSANLLLDRNRPATNKASNTPSTTDHEARLRVEVERLLRVCVDALQPLEPRLAHVVVELLHDLLACTPRAMRFGEM
jgi:predicted component of type VI protein secretion system